MRYSRQREVILEVLKHTTVHPNAEWVYAEVQRTIKNISLGTVYRNLRELHQSGQILMFSAGEGVMHFDGDISDHAHFVCYGCGRISDIFSTSGLAQDLREKGYRVEGEQLIFYGLCPDCNESSQNNDQNSDAFSKDVMGKDGITKE